MEVVGKLALANCHMLYTQKGIRFRFAYNKKNGAHRIFVSEKSHKVAFLHFISKKNNEMDELVIGMYNASFVTFLCSVFYGFTVPGAREIIPGSYTQVVCLKDQEILLRSILPQNT